jgi:[protein-PII] uridylyltransferase
MRADTEALREFVQGEWERITRRHHYRGPAGEHVPGREIMQEHTLLADTVLRRVLAAAVGEGLFPDGAPLTLVALGGYGRAELNPHSDIDVMLLYAPARCPRRSLEAFAHRLITTLWDVGFQVGHTVRTIRECRAAARSDMQSRTAMLEGRYVGGSRRLYGEFEREIKTRAMRRGVRPYIEEKIGEWREQMGDLNATVYVQEPDVKQSVGGLREAHMARWVARARFGVWELPGLVDHGIVPPGVLHEYESALDYVWRVRNELHYLAQRRYDLLTVDMQERVSKGLGYEDTGLHIAEELLMRDYYRAAQWIHECARMVIMQSRAEWSTWSRIVDRLHARFLSRDIFVLRERLRLTPNALDVALPEGRADDLLIELFSLRAQHGLPLNVLSRQQILATMPRLPREVPADAPVRAAFLRLLAQDDHVGSTLREMHGLGVLGRFIPEFDLLRALVRYDLYHRYTVDEHSLFAVGNLDASQVASAHHGGALADALAELRAEDRVALRFGVLLHDIGKGGPGDSSHVDKGVALARRAVAWFPTLTEEQRQDVLFLVAEHLAMSHTAQRRNLDDAQVVERFAEVVGSLRRARLLYLLTYADIRAVNPDLWTDWTATLLHKLYARAERYFRGELHGPDEEIEQQRDRLVECMGPEWRPAVVRHFDMMGAERMPFYTDAEVEAQVRAVADLEGRDCLLRLFEQSANYSTVLFVARDRPGLFAQVAGVLAAEDVNILSADLSTRKDGVAVDTLHVAEASSGLSVNGERVARLEALLEQVAAGNVLVSELLERRQRSRPARRKRRTVQTGPVVRIHNDESRDYTIVDVRAPDRVGLLYTITHALSELGLDISLAKISTEAYRAVDVFYVTDENRRKVRHPERLAHITDSLRRALAD